MGLGPTRQKSECHRSLVRLAWLSLEPSTRVAEKAAAKEEEVVETLQDDALPLGQLAVLKMCCPSVLPMLLPCPRVSCSLYPQQLQHEELLAVVRLPIVPCGGEEHGQLLSAGASARVMSMQSEQPSQTQESVGEASLICLRIQRDY